MKVILAAMVREITYNKDGEIPNSRRKQLSVIGVFEEDQVSFEKAIFIDLLNADENKVREDYNKGYLPSYCSLDIEHFRTYEVNELGIALHPEMI